MARGQRLRQGASSDQTTLVMDRSLERQYGRRGLSRCCCAVRFHRWFPALRPDSGEVEGRSKSETGCAHWTSPCTQSKGCC